VTGELCLLQLADGRPFPEPGNHEPILSDLDGLGASTPALESTAF
jgi:hypothetical protein